ncbi:MAG: hypothetical protein ACI9XK_004247 [Granulosicoccus sp.]
MTPNSTQAVYSGIQTYAASGLVHQPAVIFV